MYRVSYVFADDSAHALNPANAHTPHLVDEQALAGKHGLSQALRLVILCNTLRASHESILTNTPGLRACETDVGDIAQHVRRKQQLPGTGVGTMSQLGTDEELLQRSFHRSLQSHGRRHGDHEPRLNRQGTPDRKLDRNDRVAIAVGDAVRAAVESADVVDCRARADEVPARRCPARHH